jgi:hypothetical protein
VWGSSDSGKYCKVCSEDGDFSLCHECGHKQPEVNPCNQLAWYIYSRAFGCRDGFGNLDYQSLFTLMRLERLSRDSQLEIFDKVRIAEAALHEQAEKNRSKEAK